MGFEVGFVYLCGCWLVAGCESLLFAGFNGGFMFASVLFAVLF